MQLTVVEQFIIIMTYLESNNIYRYISNAPSSGNPVSNTTYWQSFIPNAAGNGLSQTR